MRLGLARLCLPALALAAVAGLLLAGGPAAGQQQGQPGGKGVPVTVAAAKRQDVPVWLDGIGNVQAYDTVMIRFVYQFHHLLPDFTALENVMLPQLLAGRSRGAARRAAADRLDRLGLSARLTHRPARLSGGEQQRVAIARALANGPGLILADEPTGNLDLDTSETVFAALVQVVRETGTAALIATHNPDLAARMDVTWRLGHGHLAPA